MHFPPIRTLPLLLVLGAGLGQAATPPPPGLKIAFLGDQGLGLDSVAVLQLVEDEGADAVLHAGDFDYEDDPAAWEAQIDAVLGADFPYFAVIGNHDVAAFDGPSGYQARIEARMNRLGIAWDGDLGVQSSFTWQGVRFVMTAPGIYAIGDPGAVYEEYIRDEFAGNDSIWRISSWHKLMRAMQVGDKIDETGWGVYEASREAGAIIATAHEHSYSRTHLMARFEDPLVSSTDEPLVLAADEAGTVPDEGRSFAFVSGLAGRTIRNQVLNADWWASVYTGSQDAREGALFGVFHVDGDPRLAHFYFKDVDGNVDDDFVVVSTTGDDPPAPVCGDGVLEAGEECDDGNTVAGDGCDELCQNESPSGFCGDAAIDPGEQCDDGNTVSGDGCSEVCQDEAGGFTCAPAAASGCLSAAKASLTISEKKPGRESWKARLASFDAATDQSDFGDPLTGSTRYDLCLYDGSGQLAAALSVDGARQSCGPKQKPCFADKRGKSWLYNDPARAESGTRKLVLGSGTIGKGKVIWQGGNKARKAQTALPTGIAAALAGSGSATLQLHTSDAACFSAELGNVKKADGRTFKAKAIQIRADANDR